MNTSVTYSVDFSWSELVDFLDEEYLELLCKRLHVKRDDIGSVPFVLINHDTRISLFNYVDLRCQDGEEG